MTSKQKTIQKTTSIEGVGLHTGKNVKLTFLPAKANYGIIFKRSDIEGSPSIPADIDYVFDTSRGTSLKKDSIEVHTVEHVLAAIIGLGIDNLIIELNNPEIPILDGSSKFYTEALLSAGIIEQDAEKKYLKITEPIRYFNQEKEVEMIAIPSEDFQVTTMIDYRTKVLGSQNAKLETLDDFNTEVAPCRTFVFLHELEYLLNNNLIKGGNLDNAIVFVNKVISEEELSRLAKLFNQPEVKVLEEGILNNVDLYFQNEPARHKMLDVIGDLALIGQPIQGQIIANRPGHKTNIAFAKQIRKTLLDANNKAIPEYDPNKPPYMDVNKIKEYLPHRPPFLLVDKIIDLGNNFVVGVKSVTVNEPFFMGHFPDEPVMPGVLIIEAMAQTGGIYALSTVDEPGKYSTYFLKIDNARFKKKIVPGDTLVFKLDLISPIRRGLVHMKGTTYVGKEIVTEAEMLAHIVKKEN